MQPACSRLHLPDLARRCSPLPTIGAVGKDRDMGDPHAPGRASKILIASLRPQWAPAARAAVGVGLPLAVTTAAGHQQDGLLMSLGAMAVLYGIADP